MIDPDSADPALVEQLVSLWQGGAARVKKIVLHPPGSTDSAMEFNQARASSQISQVTAEITRLKGDSSRWTTRAVNAGMVKGKAVADRQLAAAGVQGDGHVSGSFSVVDRRPIELLARDTYADLSRAADSMKFMAETTLRKMASNGLTVGEVNKILAGGIIQGKPTEMIQDLRDKLRKVNGEKVVIPTKNGGTITFDTDYYGRMVAVTRAREANVKARHMRLQERGVDLVRIIGRRSVHPCTDYLGHIYSLSGNSSRYLPLESLPSGGPPFHPQCSKSTSPFIEGLSSASSDSGRTAEAA